MASVLDEMTDAQKNVLKQFRENLGVELNSSHTDELLVKFLRARNFHPKAAKKVFLENYYNRITFGINTILETYEKPEVAQKYESTAFIGYAKDGTAIRYTAAGRLDFYGFIMSMSCLDLCLYFSYIMEYDKKMLEEQYLKTGKDISEITFIIDMEGFTIQQVLHKNVVEMGLDYVRLLQDCYPEIWRRVLVVNVPKIFDKAFSLFKSVIRATALEKVQLIDKANTSNVLLEHIDDDVLPAFLGGKRVDSNDDPECKEFLTFGGKVPEKFYAQHCRVLLSPSDPDVRCVSLGRASVWNFSWVVRIPDSKIRFLARSENGSILGTVFSREIDPNDDDPELPDEFEDLIENPNYKQISVEIKSQMHCTQEEALVTAPWPGIFVLRFSNAGNWFTTRKIYTKCVIIPPSSNCAS